MWEGGATWVWATGRKEGDAGTEEAHRDSCLTISHVPSALQGSDHVTLQVLQKHDSLYGTDV